ncbi:MAG TPA: HAD family phosphatase [Micromonosporaceae bacterium]
MIEAVVFDLDGVLVDTEPVWEEVRRAYVAEAGGAWQPDSQRRLMGMSTSEWARYLSVDLGVGRTPEQVADDVVRRMAARYRQALPLMPEAVDVVRRMRARVPLAVASSSPRLLIEQVLDSAGLTGDFRVTLSTEEVAAGKPAPDVYLEAARRLGVPAVRCAAVEDSANGLRSASAAGMAVVAVPHPVYPPPPDALALADVIIARLGELTPQTVEQLDTPTGTASG